MMKKYKSKQNKKLKLTLISVIYKNLYHLQVMGMVMNKFNNNNNKKMKGMKIKTSMAFLYKIIKIITIIK